MRTLQLTLAAVLGLTLAGCYTSPTPTKPDLGDGGKLKEAIVGKWTETEDAKTVSYEFDKDGSFKYDADQLKYSGTWKAVNDKCVELSYALDDDQLAQAAKVWDAASKKQKAAPRTPENRRPPLAPPQKSNTLMPTVEIDGDELTMEFHKYKRAK